MVITLIINASKCFALALSQAVDSGHSGNSGESIPSTKGVL